jgi:hypothetical protein
MVLVEGNKKNEKGVEWKSTTRYGQISDCRIKPLNTVPTEIVENGTPITHEETKEEHYKKGPFDTRKSGPIRDRMFRYLFKYSHPELWETAVEGREHEMTEKVIKQIEEDNAQRIAVIVGKTHVLGIKKIFRSIR